MKRIKWRITGIKITVKNLNRLYCTSKEENTGSLVGRVLIKISLVSSRCTTEYFSKAK